MSMLIGEFLKERNVMMRGLAHPVIFEEGDSSIVPLAMGGGMPGVRATLEKYGAVEVTPSSLFQVGYNLIHATCNDHLYSSV